MIRPTLDHFPNGSRFTPLLIKACAEKTFELTSTRRLQISCVSRVNQQSGVYLGQVPPPGLQCVGPYGDWSMDLIGLQEINQLQARHKNKIKLNFYFEMFIKGPLFLPPSVMLIGHYKPFQNLNYLSYSDIIHGSVHPDVRWIVHQIISWHSPRGRLVA